MGGESSRWIIQVSGDVPTLPWVRCRVWVGAGLWLALREGWVDACPESSRWIIQVSGGVPTLPWVRCRVWVGAGLGLALREGWVDACPESWIDSSKSLAPKKVWYKATGSHTNKFCLDASFSGFFFLSLDRFLVQMSAFFSTTNRGKVLVQMTN